MPTLIANWKRLVGWAALIFVAYQAVSLIVYTTPAESYSTFAARASAFLAYYVFFRRTPSHKRLLGAALFVLIQVIDIAVLFALSGSLAGWLDLPGTSINFAVCLLAYLASQMSSNNSFKPKPLRGSA
ncbi:hypothetical protein [Thermomonas fusca]|uniref:Uncharacterized protein n=1 Tax=Thermomonas fusca TaxID=215690 RepID=A0A5R9PAY5_9GAMM|nr:hypothetical protein [Thermomonas fusca]TLX20679.1 hypothetical protein E5S66_13395 [Thermomonas fusca]